MFILQGGFNSFEYFSFAFSFITHFIIYLRFLHISVTILSISYHITAQIQDLKVPYIVNVSLWVSKANFNMKYIDTKLLRHGRPVILSIE